MEAKVEQNRVPAKSFLQTIKETPVAQILELDIVKAKYIENFNACNPEKNGELMYHKQLVNVKQAIAGSDQLAKCDPFSIYACFVTAAVNGYSLDPQDGEVYLIPRDGNARLDIQAPAKVRRLMRTRQVQYADQAKLVYEGDDFEVINGRVLRHVERFRSDNIVAGYSRMVIDDKGNDRFFIYRKSDWEAWRKKSSNPKSYEKEGKYGKYLSASLWDNGIINGQNPEPGFLRTKIIKHACTEKCWASGRNPAFVENFKDVEIETEEEIQTGEEMRELPNPNAGYEVSYIAAAPVQQHPVSDDSFIGSPAPKQKTISYDDDNF
ncbi:MAG: recombinase RecT [Chitinophagaceae bacterium]|jgi:recombinational DNA repair protein RecT|nr:recombinase RecT [Chitinophagaceae bacterium]